MAGSAHLPLYGIPVYQNVVEKEFSLFLQQFPYMQLIVLYLP